MSCASSELTNVLCELGAYASHVRARSLRTYTRLTGAWALRVLHADLGVYACRTQTWESTCVAHGLGVSLSVRGECLHFRYGKKRTM